MGSIESALVVAVPEAEDLVSSFRDRHDPSAAEGIPAHVTLLYPFLPLDRIDGAALDELGRCFASFAPIRYRLASIRRFGSEVLYLAPEPDEPFRQLTRAIWHRFPETPPFGGRHPDIVPHLTVANLADPLAFETVASAFTQAAVSRLPIIAFAAEVALMENVGGRWRRRTSFSLGTN